MEFKFVCCFLACVRKKNWFLKCTTVFHKRKLRVIGFPFSINIDYQRGQVHNNTWAPLFTRVVF